MASRVKAREAPETAHPARARRRPAVAIAKNVRARPLVRIVHVVRVAHSFGRHPALREVSFALAPGQVLFVDGVSGVGKTTLLRLIHGQLRPSQGEVWVDGRPLHRRWGRGLDGVRRRMGFVFQDHRLLPRLTAMENVVLALQVADPQVPARRVRQRAQEVLEAVDLAGRMHAYPHELSGGEKQRVGVARAIAARPDLILADEPTSALDPARAEIVMRMLAGAADIGAAVIIASLAPTGFEHGSKVIHLEAPAIPGVRKATRR